MFKRTRHKAGLVLTLALSVLPRAFADNCKLVRLAELPVTMNGSQPTVTAQINGTDALFLLDSGAFWSQLTPAAAAQYSLRPDRTRVPGLTLRGTGGTVDVAIATVSTFTIFNVPVHNVDFLVGGSEVGQGAVGLLGQNILRIADIEYDLAGGTVRVFRPADCKHADLAYWLKPGESYSMMEIAPATARSPHTIGTVYLNGVKVRAAFDTGAENSVVGLRAAANAGIKPDSPGVVPAGADRGIGNQYARRWIATFPSLKIGDEEVRNARLRFGDIGPFDMLLGSDFFLSHRIYVASSQHKLFFSYNGGPVFAPAAPTTTTAAAEAPSAAGGAVTAPKSDTVPSHTAAEPADPAALARRAAALAARHDFGHALEDLNRACELAPNEPTYLYQRAIVRLQLQQPDPASSDIDKALNLKPDYLDALIIRADLRLVKHEPSNAVADLDAIDRVAPKGADIRLNLAGLYERADRLKPAITELDLWIAAHPQDVRLAEALTSRCSARAFLGSELNQALSDCERGLRMQPRSASLLGSRGLVYLRLGKLDKAIADYDAALRLNPNRPWSLYGRGVAKSRKGLTTEGESDIAAATSIAPHLPQRARELGISP